MCQVNRSLVANVSCIGAQIVGVNCPFARGVETEALGANGGNDWPVKGPRVAYINGPEVRGDGNAIRLDKSVFDQIDSTRRRTEAIYCGLELRSRVCFRVELGIVFSLLALDIL